MDMKTDSLTGGFEAPVFDSQSVFRMLMDGMARPGVFQTVQPQVDPPTPLGIAAGAIALTLCDHDTPVWLTPSLAKTGVPNWITFHTGAPLTQEKAEARFAFAEAGAALASFGLFSSGTQEYPDRSTTLIIEVPRLDCGPALLLRGPGIKDSVTIAPSGLAPMFIRQWADNRALFPRGVDVVLTCDRQFIGLPRTLKILAKEI
ncbi:MAG: phosphonate C-P lyase system protein PhnH [Allorhizobium sp.]